MDEREWKKMIFDAQNRGKNHDGYWGLADHIKPLIQEQKFSKSKVQDGLARMDVLQQSGLDFDFPIIEVGGIFDCHFLIVGRLGRSF